MIKTPLFTDHGQHSAHFPDFLVHVQPVLSENCQEHNFYFKPISGRCWKRSNNSTDQNNRGNYPNFCETGFCLRGGNWGGSERCFSALGGWKHELKAGITWRGTLQFAPKPFLGLARGALVAWVCLTLPFAHKISI